MSNRKDLTHSASISKLRDLVEEIYICLFCSNQKTENGAPCWPMEVQKVCEQGNIWVFSEVNSDKNRAIKQDKHVQLILYIPVKAVIWLLTAKPKLVLTEKKEDCGTP